MSRLFTQSTLRATLRQATRQPNSSRSFSSLPTLRPTTTVLPQTSIFAKRPTSLLQSTAFTPATAPTTITSAEATAVADLVPKTAISANPLFASAGHQIRCGPRRWLNMNRPSRLVRQRRHGFLNRLRTQTGRKMLTRRKAKGRKRLSA